MLPQGPDIVSSSGNWGKEVHAFKEGEEPTPRVKKWYEENYEPGTVEKIWQGGEHEVVYWEQDGKVEKLDRRPSFAERDMWPFGGMFFSLDWQDMSGMAPHIDDLKTGRMPTSWTQLKAYSWAMYRHYPWVQDNLASYTNWTRYPLGGEPIRVTKHYTRKGIEAWYDNTVVPAKRLVMGKTAKDLVNPGTHCHWCRCKPYCPAWTNTKDDEYVRP